VPNGTKLPEPSIPPGTQVTVDPSTVKGPKPHIVGKPDRIKQNLVPGKTYFAHSKGTMNVRGTDKDWGIEVRLTINYGFEAIIEREIVSNDGETIVENRHFKKISSIKIGSKLEGVRLSIGKDIDPYLDVIDTLYPEYGGAFNITKKIIEGVSLDPIINNLKWIGIDKDKLLESSNKTKAFFKLDSLSGKTVKLTYKDGQGITAIVPIKGDMTPEERDFHLTSVLISDSLIFENPQVKIGTEWKVDGSNFGGMIDPSLKARVGGEIKLRREEDETFGGKNCNLIKIVSGRLELDGSSSDTGKIGYFDPTGTLYFSPDQQIFIKGKLKGKAKFEQFSKDHLLFEARMSFLPELDISYTCGILEPKK